jgi:hypothetical protein
VVLVISFFFLARWVRILPINIGARGPLPATRPVLLRSLARSPRLARNLKLVNYVVGRVIVALEMGLIDKR